MERTLSKLGFKPLTEDSLKDFTNEVILRCKEIIKQEIKETNGYTDASIISQNYNLPLKLVAGCFDSLLKNGEIGENRMEICICGHINVEHTGKKGKGICKHLTEPGNIYSECPCFRFKRKVKK